MAFRPSRDVRNFSISPRRNRYYVSIKRDRDFNKSPEDVQIYGKPRFYPPSYDISPDRSCVKTPEVYDPADLKEMMRKAKENENVGFLNNFIFAIGLLIIFKIFYLNFIDIFL